MDEVAVCVKPGRKGKKKQRKLKADEVIEEESGTPSDPVINQACEKVALQVLNEITTQLEKCENKAAIDVSPKSNDSSSVQLDERKDDLKIKNPAEKYSNDNLLLTAKAETLDLANEVFQELERQIEVVETLKPSVFVGEERPYCSSLEMGYHWDRNKYNLVLLPDLKKVVYPDLDSFSNKTNFASSSPKYEKLDASSLKGKYPTALNTAPIAMKVDRNTKPQQYFKKQTKDCDWNGRYSSSFRPAVLVEGVTSTNAKSKSTQFTLTPEINLKIHMEPIEWDPAENQQLVLFEVNSIAYEEFFYYCKSTEGLIQAIKTRGQFLASEQIRLQSNIDVYACTGPSLPPSATKLEYRLYMEGRCTIHAFPPRTNSDIENQKIRVLFQVRNVCFEESFPNVGALDDIAIAVSKRAESLKMNQDRLKAKIGVLSPISDRPPKYTDAVTPIRDRPPKCTDAVTPILEDTESDSELLQLQLQQIQEQEAGIVNESENVVSKEPNADSQSPQNQEKSPRGKSRLSSFRKWLKGTFHKDNKSNNKKHEANAIALVTDEIGPGSSSAEESVEASLTLTSSGTDNLVRNANDFAQVVDCISPVPIPQLAEAPKSPKNGENVTKGQMLMKRNVFGKFFRW